MKSKKRKMPKRKKSKSVKRSSGKSLLRDLCLFLTKKTAFGDLFLITWDMSTSTPLLWFQSS